MEHKDVLGQTLDIGILLTNTGTPQAPTPAMVRRFLAQFLADRRVIDYPRWWWFPILYGVILNVRPRRSARLYEKVWTEQGSPLAYLSEALADGINEVFADRMPERVNVKVGMRYGEPSIGVRLKELREQSTRRVLALPLFPQYSGTTSATSMDAVFAKLKTWEWIPELRTVPDYHSHPAYIETIANCIRENWEKRGLPERLLFSFHGIPMSYSEAGDPYYEQCQETARLVAEQLGLGESRWAFSFQSRFGPQEWTQPYTDELLEKWGSAGMKSVHVICPGFAVDCLETIDEIGREGRQIFQQAGGGEFVYIPALNDSRAHIEMLVEIILPRIKDWLEG